MIDSSRYIYSILCFSVCVLKGKREKDRLKSKLKAQEKEMKASMRDRERECKQSRRENKAIFIAIVEYDTNLILQEVHS